MKGRLDRLLPGPVLISFSIRKPATTAGNAPQPLCRRMGAMGRAEGVVDV